jgi:ferredoxin--NADP+ reductase
MRLRDYDTSTRYTATVVSTARITPELTDEVRELVLDVHRDFGFKVGQSIGVLVPGDVDFGPHEHFRLYTVADLPEANHNGDVRLKICVKRVHYIDDYSGERFEGRASNYICDRHVGDALTVSGPYGLPFELPKEDDANLILIGMGTGIAPFRAMVKALYAERPNFKGAVRLFHGARSGLETLYQNDELDDFAQYYDKDTFRAFKALSPRPHWEDPIAWDDALEERGAELWALMAHPRTYVYIAGQERLSHELDKAFRKIVGDDEQWARRKAELSAGRRWVELLF